MNEDLNEQQENPDILEEKKAKEQTVEPDKESKKEKEKNNKTFSQSEVQKIIDDRLRRERERAEKDKAEAEKLASMSAEEKLQHELETYKQQVEDLTRESNLSKMSKEASKLLSAESIPVDEEVLKFVTRDTAEDTHEAVKNFIQTVQKVSTQMVEVKLKGKPPVKGPAASKMTKSEIMAIKDDDERKAAIKENYNLFN